MPENSWLAIHSLLKGINKPESTKKIATFNFLRKNMGSSELSQADMFEIVSLVARLFERARSEVKAVEHASAETQDIGIRALNHAGQVFMPQNLHNYWEVVRKNHLTEHNLNYIRIVSDIVVDKYQKNVFTPPENCAEELNDILLKVGETSGIPKSAREAIEHHISVAIFIIENHQYFGSEGGWEVVSTLSSAALQLDTVSNQEKDVRQTAKDLARTAKRCADAIVYYGAASDGVSALLESGATASNYLGN